MTKIMNSETKNCQNCKQNFVIEPEDFDFYEKIKVPPPTFCPECRLQRRLTWRNERALYKRTCSLCSKDMIAMYPQDTVFPVYCRTCWYSDNWDGASFGRLYDFSMSFFEQFKDLQKVVPRIALQVDNCVNCDYTNQIADCKNCYLLTSGSYDEDCLYSYRILNSKNVVDSFLILRSELCYESSECMDVSRLKFTEDCADSLDVSFCIDARGVQNCFMSSNLRRTSNRFRNKALSREEFLEKMKSIDTGSYSDLEKYKKEFDELKKHSIQEFAHFKNAVNFVGHTAANVKNCYYCFNCDELENCRYMLLVDKAKDSMDINNGCCKMELNYEVSTMGVNAYNIKFSADAWPNVRNVSYSETCRNDVNNLFGCLSLRKKSYCILNKQYSKEEYEKLVSKIIQHMNEIPYIDEKGRVYKYGEFFPSELSDFTYNETPAQDYFPLTKFQAENRGFRWKSGAEKNYKITIATGNLPDHIKDVKDDIANEIISCLHDGQCNDQCTKAFKIIPEELNFYRQMNLALPRLCPNCRHYERFRKRNPIKLWHRKCACAGSASSPRAGTNYVYQNTATHFHGAEHCPNEFETSYAPDRPEIVYCEQCYNAEVV